MAPDVKQPDAHTPGAPGAPDAASPKAASTAGTPQHVAADSAQPEAWIKATDVRPTVIGSRAWRVRRTLWVFYYAFCWLIFKPLYRYRCENASSLPDGPFVMLSNHQSMLDPIIVGLAFPRREFCAIARRTLMKKPWARWLLLSLNSIPIDRGESDRMAIKDALTALESGRPLLVFPEGTRTTDGTVKPFKPGVLLIIRKAKVPVVPVAIVGADSAWPPGRKLPKLLGCIRIRFGQPIAFDDISTDRDQAIKQLHAAVADLHAQLNAE